MVEEHKSILRWSGDQITPTSLNPRTYVIDHIALATVYGPGMSLPPGLSETLEIDCDEIRHKILGNDCQNLQGSGCACLATFLFFLNTTMRILVTRIVKMLGNLKWMRVHLGFQCWLSISLSVRLSI